MKNSSNAPDRRTLNLPALESWLWEAARWSAIERLFQSLLHHLMTGAIRVAHLADRPTDTAGAAQEA
jgi:hypothetical protein